MRVHWSVCKHLRLLKLVEEIMDSLFAEQEGWGVFSEEFSDINATWFDSEHCSSNLFTI